MEEKYLCVGFGTNDKGIYSRIAKIVEYKNKETKQDSAFVDLKQCKYIKELIQIGEIVTITSIIN